MHDPHFSSSPSMAYIFDYSECEVSVSPPSFPLWRWGESIGFRFASRANHGALRRSKNRFRGVSQSLCGPFLENLVDSGPSC
jgi:hypothetical protein